MKWSENWNLWLVVKKKTLKKIYIHSGFTCHFAPISLTNFIAMNISLDISLKSLFSYFESTKKHFRRKNYYNKNSFSFVDENQYKYRLLQIPKFRKTNPTICCLSNFYTWSMPLMLRYTHDIYIGLFYNNIIIRLKLYMKVDVKTLFKKRDE